ncbi:ABC transporter ATP-binding protein [Chelativorans sp. AA-79]|uniref:ABC transporter ATP-binding protein n=1 Tax=Chelativorans sp. AA-79 TaxID=3028735 RepID=UPI0023F8EA06|nr:ABC transporter ATP-binding protein [Chelativorans sp. AA-79]WEX10244.1 ABC transporter ATP-binding protein [Chelativorans sp. AA-79]
MIDLLGVSKSYAVKGVRKRVIERLTYRFPRDRNVAILGPNGAGKSTLMRLIAGTELPDEGKVVRHGRVSWPLGFAGGFNGSMTGIENIRFVARIYGQQTEAVIDYVRGFSELGRSLGLPVRTYSNGMKARLAFGLSMAIDFDCYLIDEITAVGDENFRRKSKKVFAEKLPHARIFMVSHAMNQIREYCDCGLLLSPEGVWYFDDVNDAIGAYAASNKARETAGAAPSPN